jgi:hypothetical protein
MRGGGEPVVGLGANSGALRRLILIQINPGDRGLC